MKVRTWLLSTPGVVVTAAALTLIVLAESMFPPWAPYFIVYAALAICVPLVLKAYSFGSFRAVMASAWLLTLGILALDVVWDRGISTWLYERILASLGRGGDPFYSVNAAINVMFQAVTRKTGLSLETAQILYAFFILVWAPIGEELFYRGYVYGTLHRRHGFWAAALISAAFFGIRHATHFFYLWPNVPWVAAGAWAISAFVPGIYLSYLYEKTGSLYPTMLEHALINIIWFLVG